MVLSACLLGALWGVAYGLWLWLTGPGRFLRLRRTWLSVVIGVGVDLLIGLLVVEWEVWLGLVGIVAASGVAVVAMAVAGEYEEHRGDMGR